MSQQQQQQQQPWPNSTNYATYSDPYSNAYTNQYSYGYQYPQYHQQYPYPYNTFDHQQQAYPPVPQHSYIHNLQHQTQQRQALGAAAAATLTSTLRPSTTPPTATAAGARTAVSYEDIASKPDKGGSCCYTWFQSPEALQQHQSNHKKCHMCSYEAIKVLVEDHLYHTHGVGERSKKPDGVVPVTAPKLDTPEAIQAWIAARKKNYPTAANIERKKREAQEKNNNRAHLGLVNYESDGDNSDNDDDDLIDENKDAVSSKDPSMMGKRALPEEPRRAGRRCKFFALGRCRKGDECTFIHEKPPVSKRVVDVVQCMIDSNAFAATSKVTSSTAQQ